MCTGKGGEEAGNQISGPSGCRVSTAPHPHTEQPRAAHLQQPGSRRQTRLSLAVPGSGMGAPGSGMGAPAEPWNEMTVGLWAGR